MSAIFMDGFDNYGSGGAGAANMLDGAWAAVGPDGTGTPSWGARTGQFALAVSTGNPNRYILPATKGRLFQSFGFAVDGLPTINFTTLICAFNDNSNTPIANLWVQSTGSIVLAAADNTILAETQGPIIVSRNWHFLEMDVNQAGSAFSLRVDDPDASKSPVIAATGLSFGSNAIAQLLFNFSPNGTHVPSWIDDLFIRDTAGSVNNTWLGDRRIATLLADADTPTAGWTPRYYHMIGKGILNNTHANAVVSMPASTSLDIGAGDFTVESFIRFEELPSGSHKAVVFGKWDETANQRSYQLFLGSVSLNGGALCFQTSTDGTNSTISQPVVFPWTPDVNTWYHLAMVRAAGELLLFINGSQAGLPVADSTTYFAGDATEGVGGQVEIVAGFAPNTSVEGWFDETRITVGVGRYTSNFTPTTVAFPRGTSDPHWANVALLCGYDTLIQDESIFNRPLTAVNAPIQQTTNDGPSVGVWSTIGKATPDDNTFIEAPFIAATSVLTMGVLATNTATVTVGTTDGTTPAVYTFKTVVASAFDVLIDTNIQNTLQNLYNAINSGAGSGTKYGTGTTANFDVFATQLPAGQMQVSANLPGSAGNSIATTASGSTTVWTSTTLAGGTDIPGPSNFKVQRLPPATTIVSAVQVNMRAYKSDAGIGSINSALIGALGGVATGATHSLTVSPAYYDDVFEVDPDTAGPISPTTIINGAIQINRDT